MSAYRKTVLDNGVRIVTEHVPHFRSVSAGIWVEIGSRDEEEKEQGISHLLEHMVFKGTAKRSTLDIAKEFDAIGGVSNAFTAKEHTCFHAKVMDAHLPKAMDLLLDMFLRSEFDAESLELEKSVVAQEISMIEDSPEEYVHVLFSEAFWNGNPLGRSILGRRENIAALGRADILDYIHKSYSPSNILVAAAGNVQHEDFLELVAAELESVLNRPYTRSRLAPIPRKIETFVSRDLEQVHVCLGGPGPATTDETRFTDTLLHTLLGGNMSSRLFQEIREKRGLVYAVYSFLNNYADAGMFGVYLGVGPEHLEEALQLTAKEFSRIRSGDLTSDELEAAKQYLKGNIVLGSENMDNRMLRLAKNEFAFGRFISYEDLESYIDEVTLDQVIQLSNVRLDPEQISLTTLGALPEKPTFPS